jgi:hypothetical protein
MHRGRLRTLALGFSIALPAVCGPLQRTPYHGAYDSVGAPGSALLLSAWFHHSAAIQKAVEHAPVRAEIERGGAWIPVGTTRTDGEGRAVLPLRAPDRLGAYRVRWWYKSQGAEATVHVVAAGQPATVFDIDGTLTPADSENLKDYARRLLRRSTAEGPALRVGAVEAARRAAAESLPVYLSGRPPWLARPTREWLTHHGFPPGVVVLMARTGDIVPSPSRVGRAKAERLAELKAAGLSIVRAYGNATTDIQAYAAVGVPKDRTFILGVHGGKEGTVALGEAFPD